jgi:hypothetical protein
MISKFVSDNHNFAAAVILHICFDLAGTDMKLLYSFSAISLAILPKVNKANIMMIVELGVIKNL